jgi:6-phosphofructokinase 1
VLTGGGDAPGLNAVIRGVVKTANRVGYEVLGFERGYEGLLTPCSFRVLDDENTKGILHTGGTILGTVNRGRFVVRRTGKDRRRVDPEVLEQTRRNVADLGLAGLVCIGGDGSLTIAEQLHRAGIPVVCVPKTIDNDLEATVVTFGFHSAVDFATEALDRLHTTAASHERAMIVEVMGRHAGWIATHAGIAGGADVILIPEIRWDFEPIVRKIREREKAGRKFTIIVVAEGARWPDGELVTHGTGGAKIGEKRLGGIAQRLAEELPGRSGKECRYVILGHLQRGGPPNTFDRLLATRFGVSAVRLIHEGRLGRMVSYQPPDVLDVPLSAAVNRIRKVPAGGDLIRSARALGISFGDR